MPKADASGSQPGERFFPLRASEMPDIRLDKMAGDLWRNTQEATVADRRNPLNLAMMVFDEFQMSNESSEVLPARKGFCIDHHAAQLAVGFDEGVDIRRYFLKVGSFKR